MRQLSCRLFVRPVTVLQPCNRVSCWVLSTSFTINTLFIMLSSALVTRLLKVPAHQDLNEREQKRINRIITIITVVTVIPSVLIGGYTVYNTVMERNISEYLSNEFVFADTQVVQSSSDILDREISVSLVGAPVSQDVIRRLELELAQYGLDEYTLHVTQNQNIQSDNSDVVTIALQEKTIHDLQAQLSGQQEKLAQIQEMYEAKIDCKKLSSDASAIFTKLSDCSCGVMSDAKGEYILLIADTQADISDDEYQTIRNWLMNTSGLERAELELRVHMDS